MKIIKAPQPELPHTTTCYRCGCVFEFEKHEARLHCDQRDGSSYSVNCPGCKYALYIDAAKTGWRS